ncbi:hypothetical protein GCM10017044_27200 [Kordiimonas sediminis]|uniref:PAS domain-containing protein n=1 Tax=Kordiimonas sediminis TaxID=1735581 RepID=A0A919EB49_9PROT|nr:hypothetical protein [Kordiimonas sediminis]GHF30375.1 hypothetical protein GCM10017044_27200 [Kordiimonas sediminis]
MFFEFDGPDTVDHPELKRFVSDLEKHKAGEYLTVREMQRRGMISYSDRILLFAWDKEFEDFRCSFWGSRLTSIFGVELTGKYLAQIRLNQEDMKQRFTDLYSTVFADRKCVRNRTMLPVTNTCKTSVGSISWEQVSVPISKPDGSDYGVLSYFAFKNQPATRMRAWSYF